MLGKHPTTKLHLQSLTHTDLTLAFSGQLTRYIFWAVWKQPFSWKQLVLSTENFQNTCYKCKHSLIRTVASKGTSVSISCKGVHRSDQPLFIPRSSDTAFQHIHWYEVLKLTTHSQTRKSCDLQANKGGYHAQTHQRVGKISTITSIQGSQIRLVRDRLLQLFCQSLLGNSEATSKPQHLHCQHLLVQDTSRSNQRGMHGVTWPVTSKAMARIPQYED